MCVKILKQTKDWPLRRQLLFLFMIATFVLEIVIFVIIIVRKNFDSFARFLNVSPIQVFLSRIREFTTNKVSDVVVSRMESNMESISRYLDISKSVWGPKLRVLKSILETAHTCSIRD